MSTVKTTLNIDSEIMRKIKLIAVNKNKTQTEIVNKMLEQGVKNETEINENDTLEEWINKNPKKQESLEFISELGTASEPFDSVKELKKVENGE